MNFIFISPQFPRTYWNFCDRLRRSGVNVLGIGDSPYETLEEHQKRSLTEYYRVDSLEDYDQVFRAVAFFSFKYGKIDWLESQCHEVKAFPPHEKPPTPSLAKSSGVSGLRPCY